jgi:hypothetical protein
MRTVSFVILKPREETGMAVSHAPDTLQDTAKNLAQDFSSLFSARMEAFSDSTFG